jgi:hypothetical protein
MVNAAIVYYSASEVIAVVSDATMNANRIIAASGTIACVSDMTANGRYLWEPETVASETWTPQSVSSETWTPASVPAESWTVQ